MQRNGPVSAGHVQGHRPADFEWQASRGRAGGVHFLWAYRQGEVRVSSPRLLHCHSRPCFWGDGQGCKGLHHAHHPEHSTASTQTGAQRPDRGQV